MANQPNAATGSAKAYLISLAFMLAGVAGVAYSISTKLSAPASYTAPRTLTTPAPAPSLSRSIPTHLEIPDIGVSTGLIQLGKDENGGLETPAAYDIAGWYKYSPTPGEIGPAIITGHVDNYLGPAVFFHLKDLQPGQPIRIEREDTSVVHFAVDKVEVFDQSNFPTDAVYGNIDHVGLRLITCGGTYDVLSNRYSHNVVVYASRTEND